MAAKSPVPKKRGRKKIKLSDKVSMVPVYAKKKHHKLLKEEFQPLITQKEIELETKEVKQ